MSYRPHVPRKPLETSAVVGALHDVANGIMGNTICAFGEGTAMPALAFIQKFRKEFEAYVRGERIGAASKLTVERWS